MSATLGIGGMFGMPMAGVISAHWGLPALFWVTGGFGVVLIVVLPLVVPESAVKSRGRFDFLGATVLTLAMTALLSGRFEREPNGAGQAPRFWF